MIFFVNTKTWTPPSKSTVSRSVYLWFIFPGSSSSCLQPTSSGRCYLHPLRPHCHVSLADEVEERSGHALLKGH